MADSMDFELLTPDRRLVQCAVEEVEVPGTEGDFTALPGHMPLITALRPGTLRIRTDGGESREFVLSGGYVEISASSATVLAEQAVGKAEVTRERLDARVSDAQQGAEGKIGVEKDRADKYLNDMLALSRSSGN